MLALFQVGYNGNGTIYRDKSLNEVADLMEKYQDNGWKIIDSWYSKDTDIMTTIIQ